MKLALRFVILSRIIIIQGNRQNFPKNDEDVYFFLENLEKFWEVFVRKNKKLRLSSFFMSGFSVWVWYC